MARKVKALFLFILCLALPACAPETPTAVENSLEVRFLDVGQADCVLVTCEGHSMLIDGGNADDSSLVYTCLRDMEIKRLDCIIATHPHEDRVGGLMGALSYADTYDWYSPVEYDESYIFGRLKTRLADMGAELHIPVPGDSFELGGAEVTFLGPITESEEMNDNSLVCRLVYGDISFLFTGDAGFEEEKSIVAGGNEIKSTVLKVGHHGSSDSSCYEFLRAVEPEYAVISCEKNSRYGHPHESTLSRLKDCGAEIYRTDQNGEVVFVSDGVSLTLTTEKDGAAVSSTDTDRAVPELGDPMYIGNLSSEKYHLPSCKNLPAEHNRIYFYSLEEAVNSGFSPCGSCKPDQPSYETAG